MANTYIWSIANNYTTGKSLLFHSPRKHDSVLSSGYCICGVSHVLRAYRFSGFLCLISELATINCLRFNCIWMHDAVPWIGFPSRMHSRLLPNGSTATLIMIKLLKLNKYEYRLLYTVCKIGSEAVVSTLQNILNIVKIIKHFWLVDFKTPKLKLLTNF